MDFNLLFAGFLAVAFGSWTPDRNATVLQVDTKTGIIITRGTAVAYPTTNPLYNVPFFCTQGGIFTCSFPVNAGEIVYFNGPSTISVCFAYLNDTPLIGG